MSSNTLDRIEKELRLMNTNLAEANDIAIVGGIFYDSRYS